MHLRWKTFAAAVGNRGSRVANYSRGQENSPASQFTRVSRMPWAGQNRPQGASGAGSGSGGGGGSSKTWMAPPLSTATRRPEGEMATFPPASSAGLAAAPPAPPCRRRVENLHQLPLDLLAVEGRAGAPDRVGDGQSLPRQPRAIRRLTTSGQIAVSGGLILPKAAAIGVHRHQLARARERRRSPATPAARQSRRPARTGRIHLAQNPAAAAEVLQIQQPLLSPLGAHGSPGSRRS
jgi:hypothetical protein